MNQSVDPPPTPEDSEPSGSQKTPDTPDTPESSSPAAQGATADDGTIEPMFELEAHLPSKGGATLPPGVTVGAKPSGSPKLQVIEDDEDKEPDWPEILSIVCMAIGAVGMVLSLWHVVGNGLELAGLWKRHDAPNTWVLLFHVFSNAIRFALAALLVFGGLALRAQWPSCVYWLRIWAGLKMVLVFVATLFAWAFLIVPMYHVFHGDKPETSYGHAYTIMSLGWSCLMLVWGWLLPVFVLIWFQRKPVRELVKTWADEPV